MMRAALRCVAFSGLIFLAACAEPIDFKGIVPEQIPISSEVFSNRIWGLCAVQVFEIEKDFLSRLKATGIAELQDARRSRSWRGQRSEVEALAFEPWRSGAPIALLPTASRGLMQVGDASKCLEAAPQVGRPFDILTVLSGLTYFTFSQHDNRSSGDDFLFIMVDEGLLIVAPH
jgi:hypothetical protein